MYSSGMLRIIGDVIYCMYKVENIKWKKKVWPANALVILINANIKSLFTI